MQRVVSLQARFDPNMDLTYEDVIGTGDETLSGAIASERREAFINIVATVLPYLNQLQRKVLERRIMPADPPTLEEVSRELETSTERVRQIEEAVTDALYAGSAYLGLAPIEHLRLQSNSPGRFNRFHQEMCDGVLVRKELMLFFDECAEGALPFMPTDGHKSAFTAHYMKTAPVSHRSIGEELGIPESRARKLCLEGLDTVFAFAAVNGYVGIEEIRPHISSGQTFDAAISKITHALR